MGPSFPVPHSSAALWPFLRAEQAQKAGLVSAEKVRRLSQVLGCVACHSVKEQNLFHIGPKWMGLHPDFRCSGRQALASGRRLRRPALGSRLTPRANLKPICQVLHPDPIYDP